ncbi:hypothetical protein PSHT_14334 [Puccinia striiformis]|uniref:Uncharacterized protein n=1 Tax=Puccinia striiformis TaxID=27350 RepID=A0A2S4UKQ5_9BASI|nr:hypothetical protein PSHT_14334 [Puccinia striiformis]
MHQEFCQQNPGCQFDQDTPDRTRKLWAMMNLDNKHYEQALQILCMPGGPISFLVMKELKRHQEKSNDRGKLSDPPSDTKSNSRTWVRRSCKSSELCETLKGRIRDCSKESSCRPTWRYTQGKYGPELTDMLLLTMAMKKLHAQPADFQSKHFPPCLSCNVRVLQSIVTLVRDIQTHVWCLIGAKLLKGMLNSEGDIAPGLVLPRLNKITQTVDHLLHPPLQKKIYQWTLINKNFKELKAHGPDYRMAFTKVVIVRDNKLFGTGTALADIAEHRIILPSNKEVQAQLPLITPSQTQPNPSA